MKFSLKELLKLLGPYLAVIGGVIGVYADGKTEIAMLDYRVEQVEQYRDDIKAIKELLFSIDKRLSVFEVQLEERTGRK